jgi:cell division septation protein DedD
MAEEKKAPKSSKGEDKGIVDLRKKRGGSSALVKAGTAIALLGVVGGLGYVAYQQFFNQPQVKTLAPVPPANIPKPGAGVNSNPIPNPPAQPPNGEAKKGENKGGVKGAKGEQPPLPPLEGMPPTPTGGVANNKGGQLPPPPPLPPAGAKGNPPLPPVAENGATGKKGVNSGKTPQKETPKPSTSTAKNGKSGGEPPAPVGLPPIPGLNQPPANNHPALSNQKPVKLAKVNPATLTNPSTTLLPKAEEERKKAEAQKRTATTKRQQPTHRKVVHHSVKRVKVYYIQVASLLNNDRLSPTMRERLNRGGFRYKLLPTKVVMNGTLVPVKRVLVGPFRSKTEAENMLNRVKAEVNAQAFIRTYYEKR